MTPDEVRLLDNQYAILFIRGERPILDNKYDILKHPNVSKTTDGKEKPYFHGGTEKAVASIIFAENQNVEDLREFEEITSEYELISSEEIDEYLKGKEWLKMKNNKKLTLSKKGKKIFKIYAMGIFTFALTIGTSLNVLAADDPLTVVNNLSDFIFGLIRAIGMILLGFGVVQIGLSLKSHDPSQRANGFLTLAGGIVITFAKEILNMITGG